jgi:hypothetical protein
LAQTHWRVEAKRFLPTPPVEASCTRNGHGAQCDQINKIVAQLRAEGVKVQYCSALELALKAEGYLVQHRELVEQAKAEVLRFPEFARWRNVESVRKATGLRTLAQPQITHHQENRT